MHTHNRLSLPASPFSGNISALWRPRRITAVAAVLLLSMVAQSAQATKFEGLTVCYSATSTVSMFERPSTLQTGDNFQQLAQQYGVGANGFAFVNEVVQIAGGGVMGSYFPSAAEQPSTRVHQRAALPADPFPWESLSALDFDPSAPGFNCEAAAYQSAARDGVVDAMMSGGLNNNLMLYDGTAGFGGNPPDGLGFAMAGAVESLGGGLLSVYYGREQTNVGFLLAGLDINQPVERFIFLDFYDAVGDVVDALTIQIPIITGPVTGATPGWAVLSFESLTPFYALTLATNDPRGFGIGDFRYDPGVPLPSTLALFAWVLLLLRRR